MQDVPPVGALITEMSLHRILTGYDSVLQHHNDTDDTLTPKYVRTIVVLENDIPSGFMLIHWDDVNHQGHIGILIANPDVPAAADLLVTHAVTLLRDSGCTSVSVGDRCPFGLGWYGIVMDWRHLAAALARSGFNIIDDWVILTAPTEVEDMDDLQVHPPDWLVLWTAHNDRREWDLELYHQETVAAECIVWGSPPHLDHSHGTGNWVSLEWLGVDSDHRRRGFARWLLVRQMQFHRNAGRSHIMLWTGPGNESALRLYHSMGFTDGPKTHIYHLSL
jgi:GNAT superfamily N-acetyltransferase